VEALLGRYGKIVNNAAKFSAPRGWNINGQIQPSKLINVQTIRKIEVTNPAIDSVWQAFLSLSQEDQKTLAARINKMN
jgi:hypothetical protein